VGVITRLPRNESRSFLDGLHYILKENNPHALVINDFTTREKSTTKLFELKVAQSVGLNIPQSIFSNDYEEVTAFYKEHDGAVIVKQHFPFAWRDENGKLLITGTQKLDPLAMNEGSISACPMIYQHELDMSYEIRLIVFGHTFFAMSQHKIKKDENPFFKDIRFVPCEFEAFDVPDSLKELCLKYMRKMGINYSAFDIAVDKNGDFYFIESNEAGQFLFLEENLPELKVLDAFCQYLTSSNDKFVYETFGGLTLEKFRETSCEKEFVKRYEKHMKESELSSPFELVEK
jgi:hypothetical protein